MCRNYRKPWLETETIYLQGKNIESCRACGACAKLHKCKIDDGLNEIIDKIRESKGFIVGTPVYFGTARGDLMSALQRIGYVSMNTDRFLSWKVGGPIAVARRGGQTATIQELLMFYLINDMISSRFNLLEYGIWKRKGRSHPRRRGNANHKKIRGKCCESHHQNSLKYNQNYLEL